MFKLQTHFQCTLGQGEFVFTFTSTQFTQGRVENQQSDINLVVTPSNPTVRVAAVMDYLKVQLSSLG